MAEITYLRKTDATQRSSTDASPTEVTQYTISWSDLTTAGFANSDDVLIIWSGIITSSTSADKAKTELRRGSTFAGAAIATTVYVEAEDQARGREFMWMDRVTLSTNDNIYTSLGIDAGATGYIDDFSCLVLGLGDITENTDFFYAEDTSSGNAPATDTDGASITLPAGGGDDWLVICRCAACYNSRPNN